MRTSSLPTARPLRRTPLAALILAAYSVSPCVALGATTWPVTSCLDDGGAGTLRARVTNAVSGDTVDMSGLACATIALATNGTHITVPQNSLTIVGPSATTLTIDGSALLSTGVQYDSNIFDHTGTGTLTVSHVTLTGGHVRKTSGMSSGGCIRSAGDVVLTYATVTGCQAYASAYTAYGGGVFAAHDATLTHSTVSNNTAHGAMARGGGVYSPHAITVQSSTISGNTVDGGPATGGGLCMNASGTVLSITSSSIIGNHALRVGGGRGGAIYVAGKTATITGSTISGNTAENSGGGIYFLAFPVAGSSFDLVNSTISGNHADAAEGGMYTDSVETLHISNTTIAFNSAVTWYPGLYISGPTALTMQSTLIANNSGGNGGDFATCCGVTVNADAPGNANNLIFATSVTGLPGDTLVGACPLLGPLRDNGGPTPTHALWSGSPAIDAGNVNGLPPATTTDQRGIPYARVSGAAADIGAYEVQQGDIVFGGGFDGC